MMPRALRQLFRAECSDCRSVFISWGRLDVVAFELRDLEARKRAVELLDMLGGGADAWICAACGAFGAFGD